MGTDIAPFRQYSLQVVQASGMVSVEARCTVAEAMAAIVDRGERRDVTIDAVANDVGDRRPPFG